MLFDLLTFIMTAGISALTLLLGQEQAERRRLAKRLRIRQCPACGYDIRGSLGLRCPECNGLIRIVGPERF